MPPSTLSGSPKSMTHGSMPALCRMPTAPSSRVTSHMSADIIIGCTISTGGPGGFAPGPGVGREVPPQPVHRHAFHDLERRRHRAGLQAAVAQHFQAVLRGGHQPAHWPGYCRKVHHRRFPFRHTCPPIAVVIMAQRADLSSAADGELDQRRTRDGRLRHPHTAGRRQPRRRRRRRDRRRRAQRRRQVHAAAGADRDSRARFGPGHPHVGLVGGLSAPEPTTSPPGPPSARSSSAAGPTTSGRPNPTRVPSSSTCWPRSTSTRDVADLSGGERRRVALAAVLLAGHDVLVLDEPTNHLDVEVIGWLAGHLSGLRSQGAGGGQPRPLVPRRGHHQDVGGARRHRRRRTTAATPPTCSPAPSGCGWPPGQRPGAGT